MEAILGIGDLKLIDFDCSGGGISMSMSVLRAASFGHVHTNCWGLVHQRAVASVCRRDIDGAVHLRRGDLRLVDMMNAG